MDETTNDLGGSMEPNIAPQGDGSVGPVIGTIIILAVIVLGGLYFWGQRSQERAMTEVELETTLEEIENQNSSDSPADIEADLRATEIENIDAELEGI